MLFTGSAHTADYDIDAVKKAAEQGDAGVQVYTKNPSASSQEKMTRDSSSLRELLPTPEGVYRLPINDFDVSAITHNETDRVVRPHVVVHSIGQKQKLGTVFTSNMCHDALYQTSSGTQNQLTNSHPAVAEFSHSLVTYMEKRVTPETIR